MSQPEYPQQPSDMCPTCGGIGKIPSAPRAKWRQCPTCHGTGRVSESETTDVPFDKIVETISTAKGTKPKNAPKDVSRSDQGSQSSSNSTMSERDDRLTRKSHKVYDLYHEGCGQFVRGNGSLITPYKCLCGTWEHDSSKFDWRLKNGIF